ncbi:MAG: SMI1/KNR4 family protein [Raineya sp.]|jgi:cell wall assembly regulator SMI1|nr:SMI1/KNR4 family protein [Raineya sp.]
MIETVLQKLENNLALKRTVFYHKLQKGVEISEIEKLEKQWNKVLPDDLKKLYLWRNGQPEQVYEAFVNNSMMIPLQQALEIAQNLTAMIGKDFDRENWWHQSWIPLFHNGGGDYIGYDLEGVFTGQKGQILKHYHNYEVRNVLASSLEVFLEALNTLYEKTPSEELDEYVEISVAGYPKRFKV